MFSTPPTPNGGLHIGHLSGPYLGTDAFVRFQRMNGAEVYHLAATDDFQSYVARVRPTREAAPRPRSPQSYAAEIEQTLAAMDIHPDQINHTSTEPGYARGAAGVLHPAGRLRHWSPGEKARRLFDGETGQYLFEPYIDGGCPGCGNETGGNICEICGEPNFCVDLTDPQSAIGDGDPAPGHRSRGTPLPLHELREDLLAHHAVGRAPAKVRELANRVFSRDRSSTWRSPTPPTGASGPTRTTCPAR